MHGSQFQWPAEEMAMYFYNKSNVNIYITDSDTSNSSKQPETGIIGGDKMSPEEEQQVTSMREKVLEMDR